MESMTGRVALVAGASKGIGAATAEAFAAAGARVVLAARDLTALEGVAKRIADSGGQAIAVRTDVSDEDSMRNLAHRDGHPHRRRAERRHQAAADVPAGDASTGWLMVQWGHVHRDCQRRSRRPAGRYPR